MVTKDAIGMWFLPEFPNESLSGTLDIDENGKCQLQVPHNFGSIQAIGSNETIPIIHGFMADGKKVTLLHCIPTNQQWGFPGFLVTNYTSSIAIIGEWYSSEKDIDVFEMTASYDYLNYWINNRPFEIVGNDEKKEIYMTYRMPERITCNIGSEEIELTYKVNSKSDSYSNFEINQSEFVCFKFAKEVYYQSALIRIYDFANFLTLCVGKRVSPVLITSKNQEGQDIEFIFPRDKIDNEMVKEQELYIKFTYIRDIFEDTMKKWQAKKELLKPIIDYFVEAHEKEFRIPISFLKVVQAIEAYSRRMRKNEMLPPEEFEKKVQSILERIDSGEDQKWVRSIISNEPRLRQRLTELFGETNYIFDISSKKRKSFINKIVDTRNYYTHFDNKLIDKILKPNEIFYVSGFIKMVLRVLLLQELGLNQQLIVSRMQNDQELIHIKNGLKLTPPAKLFDLTFIPIENEQNQLSDEEK